MPIDTSALTPQAQITAIYVSYFNRAPDAAGLEFWTGQLDGGRSLEQIATDFSGAAETKAAFPFFDDPDAADTSATVFITSVYQNLFGRTPDDDGLAFWSDQLDTGSTPVGEILLAIIEGAQDVATGGFPDSETVTNKIEVGVDWAESAEAAGVGVTGGDLIAEEVDGELVVNDQAAFVSASSVLDGVDETDASVAAATGSTDAFFAGDGTGDDTGDGTGDDTGDGTGDDTGDGTGDDTGDDTGGDTGDGTGDDTGDGTGDDTGDGTGDDTGDGTGDDTGDGTGDDATVVAVTAADTDVTADDAAAEVFTFADETITTTLTDFDPANDSLDFPDTGTDNVSVLNAADDGEARVVWDDGVTTIDVTIVGLTQAEDLSLTSLGNFDIA